MKKVVATIVVIVVLVVTGGVGAIYSGVYNVSAIEQHTAPVFWALATTSRRSIAVRSDGIEVPDLSDPARIETGLSHYQAHCVKCHGAPGIEPQDFAMAMTPVPPNLLPAAREWPSEEIFWTIKHGIKMSGMPGWKFQLPDEDIWAITAFMETLPTLTPGEYRDLASAVHPSVAKRESGEGREQDSPHGDRELGKQALTQYACTSCHRIEGIVGPDVRVGPPLRDVEEQKYIAGVLPNTRQNLVDWMLRPQEIDPLTAMPDMHVAERHAWDMAAYLYNPD